MFQEIEQKLNELQTKIKQINSEIKSLIYGCIRSCEHIMVYSSVESRMPRGRNEGVICMNCGIYVSAERRIDTPLISLRNSNVVVETPKDIKIRYHLTVEQAYALTYPRRFEFGYLKELFENSPWTAKEIIDADSKNYVVDSKTYESHGEWYNDNYYSS